MSEVSVERRSELRRRSLLRGSVVFADGKSSMDCIVRDITSKGARLKFSGPALVTPNFVLRLIDRGETHVSQKVWMRGDEMGTKFV